MSLVSYEFAAFCIALLVVYYLVPGRHQWLILLAASCLFYACGGPVYLLYPLVTTVTTWFLAGRIGRITEKSKAYIKEQNMDREAKKAYNRQIKKRQRRLMVLGLVFNFGILAVLKYTNFVLANVETLFHMAGMEGEMEYADWLLPLGISYYTFQSMGYLIDVYHRKYEPERSPARLALFVSYFPQMTAGPISRFDRLKEELFSEHPFSAAQLKLGAERILWGYFKKLVIADRIGPAASVITASPELYGGPYVLFGMVGHVVELYADFSGGIDIVLGVSQMFGIRLPENFERPFFSKNLAEFWRRWHMSLMQWFREYIFYPVSTSHASRRLSGFCGRVFGKGAANRAPVYLASVTVWLVTGIWHGASWEFVLWGLANCAVLLASQELSGVYRACRKRFAFMNRPGYRYFEAVRTFFVFCILQMFAYYPFPLVFVMMGSMLTGGLIGPAIAADGAAAVGSVAGSGGFFGTLCGPIGLSTADLAVLGFACALMLAVEICGRSVNVREKIGKKPVLIQYLLFFGLFLLVLTTGVYGYGYDVSQFIYNRF